MDEVPIRCTPKEAEVVILAAKGLKSQAIASKLWISPKTVHAHLNNVYRANDIHSRVELTRRVLLAGMIVRRLVDVTEGVAAQ